jgi:Icc-related predicted phosphoesterase
MVKIYAVADIHGAQFRVNEINDIIRAYHPDITCVCGDITQFGPADMATLILDQIPGKVIVITGNIDTPDVIRGIKQSHAEYIQYRRYEFRGVSFIGINGVSENETSNFYLDKNNATLLQNIDVLVTHVPPYGFQDIVFLGKHAGSKILTEITKTIKPRLLLCGHIHENPGYLNMEDTTIVNCSMGKRGSGAIIKFDKIIDVEMI